MWKKVGNKKKAREQILEHEKLAKYASCERNGKTKKSLWITIACGSVTPRRQTIFVKNEVFS